MMYEYNVYQEASNEKFLETCQYIESFIPNIVKENLLVDVDGTGIQRYFKGNQEIKVYNDYEVDAVYVESDIELPSVR